jgi:flavodoxin
LTNDSDQTVRKKLGIIIFDSRYGNTEKIAKSVETGAKEAGIDTSCVTTRDVDINSLKQYDLICVGGPTQYRTASESMQNFLRSIEKSSLSGKFGFVFDTRRESILAGSAAKFIEERLRKLGLKMVSPGQSAIIFDPQPEEKRGESESKDEWKERRHRREKLRDGEEEKFEKIGFQVGTVLLEKGKLIQEFPL